MPVRPPTPRSLAVLTAALLAFASGLAHAFGFEDVAARAKALAAAPFKPPAVKLPQALQDLDYDAYRDIRFRPEKALWRAEKLPFEVMFFLQGRAVSEPVRVHVVEPSGERVLPFDLAAFDFGKNRLEKSQLAGVSYNGFRVHYAINQPAYKDEVLVFLGASYFRAVGKDQGYGLSARGLAVDTASATGEEFPRFTEFWLERPRPSSSQLVVHALLDSKRIAGAYRFVVKPGVETTIDVQSRLYLREPVAKLGIAPLTSMYQFGENQPGRDDFRPEVHDSDGLSMLAGDGEWIWRPLVNPRRLLVTSFSMTDPKGFGLMQRDRSPDSYEDPEAQYEKRPSAWIEPVGAWGAGRVELVQIPTPDETNDNIVAYWVPQREAKPGQPLDFAYRIRWQTLGALPADKAWVVQSRRGRGFVRRPDGDLQYTIDFDGKDIRSLPQSEGLEAVVWADSNAEIRERNVYRNRSNGRWRMTLRFRRIDAGKPVEMRAYLQRLRVPVSETWSYILPAEPEKP